MGYSAVTLTNLLIVSFQSNEVRFDRIVCWAVPVNVMTDEENGAYVVLNAPTLSNRKRISFDVIVKKGDVFIQYPMVGSPASAFSP